MIKELKKTYEYLPKVQGEERRELFISNGNHQGYEIRLTIWMLIGKRINYAHSFTEDLLTARFDFEEYAIKKLCEHIRDFLVGEETDNA